MRFSFVARRVRWRDSRLVLDLRKCAQIDPGEIKVKLCPNFRPRSPKKAIDVSGSRRDDTG